MRETLLEHGDFHREVSCKAFMADLFCEPSAAQQVAKSGLVGRRISLWWDGDAVFFSAKVIAFDTAANVHNVRYDNDDTSELYPEVLSKQPWKIWNGNEEDFKAYNLLKVEETRVSELMEEEKEIDSRSSSSSMKMSYSVMAVEAVMALAERNGSSLVAIRKYIQANYPLKQQQIASFNSLTLKGVSKAVATNELEKLKHSYKLTSQEKERRKEKDRRANYIASGRNPRDAKRKKGGKGFKKGGRNNRSSSVYDFYFPGSAAESNRPRRRDIERLRERRDIYLDSKKELLTHFLNDNDYFKKKEKREKKSLEKVERKKKEDTAAALALKVLRESAKVSGENSMEDTACAAIALLSAGVSVVSQEPSESSGTASSLVELPIVVSEVKADTGVESVKCVSWDSGVAHNGSAPLSSNSVNGEEGGHDEDDDGDEDVSAAPVELDVSYAMRGVPIVAQPPTLIAELHEHQIQGISWMAHMFTNGMPMILGDQMGLGKTIQSIGLLAHLQSALGQGGPHLVVVPLSVLSNWLSEIERFCPSMRAVRFHGPKAERNRIKSEELSDTTEFDIVVTTFEILVSEVNFFKRKYVWTTIIVDEGHRLKNEKSQLSEKLRSVSCLSKIILTGTPLQNNLRELWALLHFLAQDVFTPATAERFETGFDLVKGLVDSRLLRRARRLLGVFMLRRVKDQVAISLPSRRELTVLVPLTKRQVEWYKRLLCGLDSDVIETVMRESSTTAPTIEMDVDFNVSTSTALTAVKPKNGKAASSSSSSEKNLGASGDSDWRKLMNLLLQLRKICNHIYLMPDAAPEPYDVGEHVVGGSGKLLMLDRMLPRLREDGHRVLLFSQFTSMLDLLEDYCELRDLPYVRLDGETNRVQRRLDVRRFNAPRSPLFIFLISTRAGGLGLNLASADTVILYDSDWNPQVDLQAMERAHRIGQVKPVRVYRLVCSGSVEERMVSRAEKKLFLNAMVAETDAEEMDDNEVDHEEKDDENQALGIGGATMSKGELASLIRFGANAVFESAGNTQISDADLDKLLERQGRDKPFVAPTSQDVCTAYSSSSSSAVPSTSDKSSASASAAAAAMSTGLAMDDLEAVQAALRDRMELLTEVDLRQLGNTLYTRRKSRPKSEGIDVKNIVGAEDCDEADEDPVNNKRIRKERVVMIDGKGTGYGGAVPVLLDSMDLPAAAAPISRHRTRAWTHMPFCAFCARSKSTEANSICKCAHCPRVFHTNCMDEKGIPKGAGMFICPHHKCASCNRSTAAAGGLLFRCMGCLTSYCEDCLPQDEIESIGRCRSMEDLGYESKQSYYIMCPSCCLQDGVTAKGVVGDRDVDADADDEAEDEEEEDHEEEEEDGAGEGEGDSNVKTVKKSAEQEAPLLPTQHMRVVWDEEPDSEEERHKKSILLKAAKKAEKDRVKKEKEDAALAMREKKRDLKKESKESAGAKTQLKGKAPVVGLVRSKRLSQLEEEIAVVSKKEKKVVPKMSAIVPQSTSTSRYPARGGNSAPRAAKGTAKATGAVSKRDAAAVEESEEEDSSEEEEDSSEEEDDEEYKVRIPLRCELGDALNILLAHPRSVRQGLGSMKDNLYSTLSAAASSSSHPFTVTLDAIQTKLASGRYRSVVPFVSDVRAFLNSFKSPKGSAGKGKSSHPSEEETVHASLTKRRRIPALPSADTGKSRILRPPLESETEENLQILIDFFNDRLVNRLATL